MITLIGPSTGLGHNSAIHVIESQLNLSFNLISQLGSSKTFELSVSAMQTYTETMRKWFSGKTFELSKCNSHYGDQSHTHPWQGHALAADVLRRFRCFDEYLNISNF